MKSTGSKAGIALAASLLGVILVVVLLLGGGGSNPPDDSDDGETGIAYGGLQSAGLIPADYMPVLLNAGKVCPEITPAILAAQTYAESGFKDVTSPVGALGPSQFMPDTWPEWGKGGNIHDFHDSIPAQARFDCSLVTSVKAGLANGSLHGDLLTLVLDSYNAGYGAIQQYHGVPPFPETQAYAPKILAQAAKFATNVGGGPLTSLPAGVLGDIIRYAVSQTGKPYILGAGGPGNPKGWPAYDCSGLVSWAVWMGTGGKIVLPHYAASIRTDPHLQQVEIGKDLSVMKPGDIIIFNLPGEDPKPWGHAAIYIGGGQIMEAALPGIKTNDLVHGWGGYYMRPNYQWDVLRIKGL